MTIHVHFHSDEASQRLGRLEVLITELIKGQNSMATALDAKIQALKDAVAAETAVDQSILTFIQGVPALIAAAVAQASAAGATDEELQALTDLTATITANAKSLTDAVTANTTVAAPPAVDAPLV